MKILHTTIAIILTSLMFSCQDEKPTGHFIGPIKMDQKSGSANMNFYSHPQSIFTLSDDAFALRYLPNFALFDTTKIIHGEIENETLIYNNNPIAKIGQFKNEKLSLEMRETTSNYVPSDFDKMGEYNLGSKFDDIKMILQRQDFTFGLEKIALEFGPKNLLITPGMSFPMSANMHWDLIRIDDELFLLLGTDVAKTGHLLHITQYNERSIRGIVYGWSDILIELNVMDDVPAKSWSKNELIGSWRWTSPAAISKPDNTAPVQVFLHFSDSTMVQQVANGVSDTLPYVLNRQENLILFPSFAFDRNKRKWQIIELTEATMKISKFPPTAPYVNPKPPEELLFMKVK